jgi:uncharacterized membrane protein
MKHLVGGIIISLALIFYVFTLIKAKKHKKHNVTAIIAVSLDIIGSLIMSGRTPGIYLVENFEKLNVFQIFHLLISPIAIILMVLTITMKKIKNIKKLGE